MSAIHQIYCTHCTHGSSALERREGDLAGRMLGYSARAGSLQAAALRKCYRQVEHYAYYYLPRDTPGEQKLRLTASTAPRRLIYLTAGDGLQMVGQICYRPRDTEGRPGSYFAHVLFSDQSDVAVEGASQPAAAAWRAVDCLKLWRAPGWVEEDSPEIPFMLRPFAGPEEMSRQMLGQQPPAVDDEVLMALLTSPADGAFHDPGGVVPPRWRRQDPRQRRAVLIEALDGLLQLGTGGGSLLLVAEPSVAALIFYGMLRLLPGGRLRDGVSFSTFEPDPQRLCTTLAATRFHDPQAAAARAAARRAGGPTIDTIGGGQRPQRDPSRPTYAACMIDKLLSEGWGPVDRALADMEASGARSVEDLERLAQLDRWIPKMLAHGRPPPPDWHGSRAGAGYLRRAILQQTAAMADPHASLRRLVGLPAHLLVLGLIAGETENVRTRRAVEYLLTNLTELQIGELLERGGVSTGQKAAVLARYVTRHGVLPPGCDRLWHPAPAPPGPEDPAHRPLLPELLARLDPSTIGRLYDNLSGEQSLALLGNLVEIAGGHRTALAALTQISGQADESTWIALLHERGPAFFQGYPQDEPALGRKLMELLLRLPDDEQRFPRRLDLLLAAEHLLDDDSGPRMVTAWSQCRRAILDVGRLQGHKSGVMRTLPAAELEDAVRRMILAIDAAMPAERFDDDEQGSRRQACLRRIGRRLLGDRPLLPPAGWQSKALWQKTEWYFQRSQWPLVPLERMRRKRRPSKVLLWIISAGVAAAAVVAIGLWLSNTPASSRPDPAAPKQPSAAGPQPKRKQQPAAAERKQSPPRTDSQPPVEHRPKEVPPSPDPEPKEVPVPGVEQPPPKAKPEEEEPPEPVAVEPEPPAADPPDVPKVVDSPRPEVPLIPGEFKLEADSSRFPPQGGYMAAVNVHLVAQGMRLPRWLRETYDAECALCELADDVPRKDSQVTDITTPKRHRILDGTAKTRIRFEFYRKLQDDLVPKEPEKAAHTAWQTIEPVESGTLYTAQFLLTEESLDKLRALAK